MNSLMRIMMIVVVSGFSGLANAADSVQDVQRHHHPGHPGHPGYVDLCQGTYWGSWSNGVGVTMRLVRNRWNQIDMWIENQGGYVFTGWANCYQNGYQATIDFTMQGYGATSNNHGQIRFDGYRTYLSGYQEVSGLYFNLQR